MNSFLFFSISFNYHFDMTCSILQESMQDLPRVTSTSKIMSSTLDIKSMILTVTTLVGVAGVPVTVVGGRWTTVALETAAGATILTLLDVVGAPGLVTVIYLHQMYIFFSVHGTTRIGSILP